MGFRLVEETKDHSAPAFVGRTGGMYGTNVRKEISSTVLGHKVWRCEFCKALACGTADMNPPSVCGKCKR